jgi:hypothetical protein
VEGLLLQADEGVFFKETSVRVLLMKVIVKILPVLLYAIVGIISLLMFVKTALSGKLLPFQEEAAGKSWDTLDPGLQSVLLTLLKLSGLGFLVIGLLLCAFPFIYFSIDGYLIKYLIPGTAFLFCLGLCLINYQLHARTRTDTPWKGSLYSAIFIAVGIVVSIFQK